MKYWTAPFLCVAASAFAHEGHGFEGPHWHATDAWGFVVGAVAIWAAALWWRGRK